MTFNVANVTRSWSIRPGGALQANYQGSSATREIWDYDAGSDNISDIESGSYFTPDAKLFASGDLLRVTANDGKALYRVEAAGPLKLVKLADVDAFAGDYPVFTAGA